MRVNKKSLVKYSTSDFINSSFRNVNKCDNYRVNKLPTDQIELNAAY